MKEITVWVEVKARLQYNPEMMSEEDAVNDAVKSGDAEILRVDEYTVEHEEEIGPDCMGMAKDKAVG